MSAYKANRNGDSSNLSEKERADKNNAQNVRNAADVAIASGHPVAAAIGGAVKTADKITGGKASEGLGKAATKVMNKMPNGKAMQNASNKLSESGASDAIGKAAAMKNGAGGTSGAGGADAAKTGSGAQGAAGAGDGAKAGSGTPKKPLLGNKDNSKEKSPGTFSGEGFGNINFKKVAMILLPVVVVLFGFLLLILSAYSVTMGGFDEAFGAAGASGESTGNLNYSTNDPKAQEFYKRINEVKLSLQMSGKNVTAVQIVAVYRVLASKDASINYESMTTDKLKAIGIAVADGYSDDADTYASNLANSIFAEYFPDYEFERRKNLGMQVVDYIENYNDLVSGYNTSTCAAQGTCSYTIKGINTGNTSVAKNLNAGNIKVRLMNCKNQGWGTPIAGEQLIDLEKYILGVVYGEMGEGQNTEVYKVQAVVARSFALSRPTAMNNSGGTKLISENGQTILQIRNCTEDQVYCDPDQGCSTTVSAVDADRTGATIYSGAATKPVTIKRALAQDSPLRSAVSSVMGQVAVDSNGYIANIGYQSTIQNRWKQMVSSGMDYKQVIISDYSLVSSIVENTCNINGTSSCAVGASGPYANWKQYEGSWVNITLGNSGKTINQIGCLATSISMLIAKSGVPTNVQGDFNPGSFVEAMNRNGGFVNGGNLVWGAVQRVAPQFKYVNKINVHWMSQSQKLSKLQELLNQGYYVVAEVKGDTGQHWVAIDNISNNQIVMMDPGSSSTNMWARYNWVNTSCFSYFKVG